ncbi:MAG: NAD-dependent epimerase/dehydratase family protein [Smithella sp.]|nr:NAD-dependent epimerase/dehydratase family protein [Smithella sp.]
MNILVTGAGGFLGTHLSEGLLSKGHKVWNFSRTKHPQLEAMGVETICGDLRDETSVAKAFRGMDVVFHVPITSPIKRLMTILVINPVYL